MVSETIRINPYTVIIAFVYLVSVKNIVVRFKNLNTTISGIIAAVPNVVIDEYIVVGA